MSDFWGGPWVGFSKFDGDQSLAGKQRARLWDETRACLLWFARVCWWVQRLSRCCHASSQLETYCEVGAPRGPETPNSKQSSSECGVDDIGFAVPVRVALLAGPPPPRHYLLTWEHSAGKKLQKPHDVRLLYLTDFRVIVCLETYRLKFAGDRCLYCQLNRGYAFLGAALH